MNRIELFNEFCALFGSVLFISMKALTDGEQLYRAGLFFNYIVLICCVVNFFYVLSVTISEWCSWFRMKEKAKNVEAMEREQEWLRANALEQLAKKAVAADESQIGFSSRKLMDYSRDDIFNADGSSINCSLPLDLKDNEQINFDTTNDVKLEKDDQGEVFDMTQEERFEGMIADRRRIASQISARNKKSKESLQETFSKMNKLKAMDKMKDNTEMRKKIIMEVLDKKKKERAEQAAQRFKKNSARS